MQLLLVEDERSLREALVDLLSRAGHGVTAVDDGERGLAAGLAGEFDLALLDLMLPKLDGLVLCQRLREKYRDMGIILLTARGAEEDKVRGFAVGADDYITKPFGAKELLARIEALGRRVQSSGSPNRIEFDGCTLDLGMCRAQRGVAVVSLTAREVEILRCLHRHRGRALSRGELLEQVWLAPADLQTRTVDMTIANLRAKIEQDPARPRIVLTVKGVGYAFGDSPAN
jgi:two-component system response regulator RegX3